MVYDAHIARRYKRKPFGITKAKRHIKEFMPTTIGRTR